MTAHEIVSQVLFAMAVMAKPGVTTASIDDMAEALIPKLGGTSVNKGYKPTWAKSPYPAVSCININFMIAHGVPSEYKLQEGDLVSFDLGVRDSTGMCGDAALTVGVGQLSADKERLRYYTKKTLYAGIQAVRAGVSTREITQTMEHYALSRGVYLNKAMGGHTIGKNMHMSPNIYNTDEEKWHYEPLVEGQVICIEPMGTFSRDQVGVVADDGWTRFIRDGKPSALFEHMVRVDKDGATVLTTHFKDEVY